MSPKAQVRVSSRRVFSRISALAIASGVLMAGAGVAVRSLLTTPSVVLIVVDTLRADRLDTMSNLNTWAQRGRVYENAHSTSPWTQPSFGSLYTGYLPVHHHSGFRLPDGDFRELNEEAETLAERFSRDGFETKAIINNPLLNASYEFHRGFQVYDYNDDLDTNPRSASDVVSEAIKLLERGRRSFIVVHIFDPHLHYNAPAPFRGRFTRDIASDLTLPIRGRSSILDMSPEGADREFIRAAYDEEVAFTDHHVDRLMQVLDEQGYLDSSLVIFTSDHGEEFWEHDGFEHGHAMWQEVIHVPLVVWGKGVLPGREESPVSLVDLAPTVLEWAGLDYRDDLDGISLLENLRSGEALPERSVISETTLYGEEQRSLIRWPHKLVVDARGEPTHFFSLDSDPGETSDLLHNPQERERVAMLEELLRLHAAREDGSTTPAKPDDATLRKLRSLGYIR